MRRPLAAKVRRWGPRLSLYNVVVALCCRKLPFSKEVSPQRERENACTRSSLVPLQLIRTVPQVGGWRSRASMALGQVSRKSRCFRCPHICCFVSRTGVSNCPRCVEKHSRIKMSCRFPAKYSGTLDLARPKQSANGVQLEGREVYPLWKAKPNAPFPKKLASVKSALQR